MFHSIIFNEYARQINNCFVSCENEFKNIPFLSVEDKTKFWQEINRDIIEVKEAYENNYNAFLEKYMDIGINPKTRLKHRLPKKSFSAELKLKELDNVMYFQHNLILKTLAIIEDKNLIHLIPPEIIKDKSEKDNKEKELVEGYYTVDEICIKYEFSRKTFFNYKKIVALKKSVKTGFKDKYRKELVHSWYKEILKQKNNTLNYFPQSLQNKVNPKSLIYLSNLASVQICQHKFEVSEPSCVRSFP